MKKRAFKKVILLGVFLLLVFLGYGVISKLGDKHRIQNTLNTIPNFSFKTLQESSFTHMDLKNNSNTVFIYFNSTCEYCQEEAKSIASNSSMFSETQILMVSSQSRSEIEEFAADYGLDEYRFITFLQDDQDVFSRDFDATSIPYILIYDKNKNLVKRHKGQLNINYVSNLIK